ncbi:hypothetical protein I0C86_41390 [Plantactinospora sp. S1510]|uniref:Uncharacterized protein n=1 Tax=Plantactinospora alkalitolerans TaxID=2789879 RepID=A0ABS0H9Z6_9ACTN|nr:hypothetical protein [Plantactinospora alkalitolerans]MBF9135307.1 hypothetical protein [Plantactinospora alkalitolerans]
MTEQSQHARAFDLPGWPCPPRVRDIPKHHNSWGHILVVHSGPVAQDELGYLWVNGETIPRFQTPNETLTSPGALVFWTESGLGLWVHPKSLRSLPSISRLDMRPDEWLAVNEVASEWPDFIKSTS